MTDKWIKINKRIAELRELDRIKKEEYRNSHSYKMKVHYAKKRIKRMIEDIEFITKDWTEDDWLMFEKENPTMVDELFLEEKRMIEDKDELEGYSRMEKHYKTKCRIIIALPSKNRT
jgi:hypothetical protein